MMRKNAHRSQFLVSMVFICTLIVPDVLEAQVFGVADVIEVDIQAGLGNGLPVRNVYRPVWSPDANGRYLAVELIDRERRQLCVMDMETRRTKVITSVSRARSRRGSSRRGSRERHSSDYGMVWRRRPGVFVYVGSGGKGLYSLYRSSFDGTVSEDILANGVGVSKIHYHPKDHSMYPAYHPVEDLVVYCRGAVNGYLQLTIVQTEGRGDRQGPKDLLKGSVLSAVTPQFSPTSTSRETVLAFVGGAVGENDIYTVRINDLTARNFGASVADPPEVLVEWESVESHPRWSPDGSQIAFLSNKEFPQQTSVAGLYVMNANGTALRRLAERVVMPLYPDYDTFVWHPSQPYIFFSRQSDAEKDPISYVNVSSGQVRTLNTETVLNSDLAIHPDGTRLTFCAQGETASINLTWRKLYEARLTGP
jgi:hypothetical protein